MAKWSTVDSRDSRVKRWEPRTGSVRMTDRQLAWGGARWATVTGRNTSVNTQKPVHGRNGTIIEALLNRARGASVFGETSLCPKCLRRSYSTINLRLTKFCSIRLDHAGECGTSQRAYESPINHVRDRSSKNDRTCSTERADSMAW